MSSTVDAPAAPTSNANVQTIRFGILFVFCCWPTFNSRIIFAAQVNGKVAREISRARSTPPRKPSSLALIAIGIGLRRRAHLLA